VSDPNGNGNGDDKPADALPKIRERIARNQNKGEREEQAAFARTHNARESGRAARVKAAKDRKDGTKK
jgi:hypothetical protein